MNSQSSLPQGNADAPGMEDKGHQDKRNDQADDPTHHRQILPDRGNGEGRVLVLLPRILFRRAFIGWRIYMPAVHGRRINFWPIKHPGQQRLDHLVHEKKYRNDQQAADKGQGRAGLSRNPQTDDPVGGHQKKIGYGPKMPEIRGHFARHGWIVRIRGIVANRLGHVIFEIHNGRDQQDAEDDLLDGGHEQHDSRVAIGRGHQFIKHADDKAGHGNAHHPAVSVDRGPGADFHPPQIRVVGRENQS